MYYEEAEFTAVNAAVETGVTQYILEIKNPLRATSYLVSTEKVTSVRSRVIAVITSEQAREQRSLVTPPHGKEDKVRGIRI